MLLKAGYLELSNFDGSGLLRRAKSSLTVLNVFGMRFCWTVHKCKRTDLVVCVTMFVVVAVSMRLPWVA